MPSRIFATEEVLYGGAPFKNASLGYNESADALNLILDDCQIGGRAAVLEVKSGVTKLGTNKIKVKARHCFVGPAIKAQFASELRAQEFAEAIGGPARVLQDTADDWMTLNALADLDRRIIEEGMQPSECTFNEDLMTHLQSLDDQTEECLPAAPSTPPKRTAIRDNSVEIATPDKVFGRQRQRHADAKRRRMESPEKTVQF
eukprot:gnl/MRDRNA2_/MRDRNA2_92131_c0_seq1.p1 gnl/MRDRNA2_/MRDRNA2_92131_c0~~gnl/MRDRNA2_/MRDRNA2_92131_c0_seq1.p1  ORF type:complete len:202 (+),score=56.88 gnl/MRDRNA2_/MRDRNA2_92131_c0_seq1:98-703(+)